MPEQQIAFAHEIGAGLASDQLPSYAPMLTAFHRACGPELEAMLQKLPLVAGMQVLDMACGDGFYTGSLAEHVGPTGQVVAVDLAPAYLALARQQTASSPQANRIRFEQGTIEALPFADDTFDLAWCAHSLYSLPDPIAALRELQRVVRRGGTVAILENDTLHHMLLPWPPELELAVRRAQLAALEANTQMTGKFYIGRHLCSLFDTVGLHTCGVASSTIDHHAPLTADERTYLEGYLQDLQERARPYLEPAAQTAWDLLLKPNSDMYLLDQPHFFASHLELLAQGVKA